MTPPASRRESAGWVYASTGGEFDLREAECEAAVADGLTDQVGPLSLGVTLAVLVAVAPLAGQILIGSVAAGHIRMPPGRRCHARVRVLGFTGVLGL
jgi:hypothetical protein